MRIPAVACVLLLLGAVGCGRDRQVPESGEALCSPSYEPRELVVLGPCYSPPPIASGRAPGEARSTDPGAIRKVAAAACSLPAPPPDVACTAEMGPAYQLRFVDTRGRATTLDAAGFGCRFVDGLGVRRFDARPLWAALTAAGLPAPGRR
ncbi:hypothetical protein [Amycolatopsis australiensis]|uniref:Uncharacterized protein n=1 Tax=Amycolatopsis australiensis TaxID=546364 RepID=A0A1K1S1K9_9PSEU|nr:hypothetical protein [Amycolatopsis australiensis]SFW78042.1 hypothetical protein SAMN04489730_4429 [Amycolatopsis australiensis]